MKLTKENYESLLFDLLEGNLSNQQAKELIKQIEEDVFFQNEWELLQTTVLKPDQNIVFPNKRTLFKKESRIIPIRTLLAVGIAASLLFAFFIFIRPEQENSIVNNNTPIPQHHIVPILPNNDSIQEQLPVLPKQVKDIVETEHQIYKPKTVALNVIKSDSTLIYGKISQEEMASVLPEIKTSFEIPSPEKTDIKLYASTNPKPVVNRPSEKNNLSDFVTNKPKERIEENIKTRMALLKNPKIRITPIWKHKKLNIEIETDGYYTVAQIAPLKRQP